MIDNYANRLALSVIALTWYAVATTFPAFPIDETRYLTVAWEMRQSGQWILPTLNGQPYSHKPPLLFWLINIMWSAFGPAVWSARVVSLLTMIAVFLLTGRLAGTLYPDRPLIRRIAPLLALASPFFMIYGGMIMFDFLLYAAILLSLLFLWRAAHDTAWRNWICFGLAMGFGVLAKGPVILVHILGPALLAPLWMQRGVYGKAAWYSRILVGILIATAVGLAWAIPAAIIGGHDFAHMIFWGQSADRMVNSFAHRRPAWFYLPFVPVFMLPWLFLPRYWRGLRELRPGMRDAQGRFIVSWIAPAFIAFSLISGKQLHYLVPLTSGLAILTAACLDRTGEDPDQRPGRPWFILLYLGALAALLAAPHLPFILHDHKNRVVSLGVAHFEVWPFIAAFAGVLVVGWLGRGRLQMQILAMAACGGLVLAATTLEGARFAYVFYDLAPLEQALAPYGGHPIAYVGKYAGEIGFTARLTHPVEEQDMGTLAAWFVHHPDGFAVMRHEDYETLPGYKILHTQPYRGDQHFSVIVPEHGK